MPDIVVGRDDEDLRRYGSSGTAVLGRHIVGTGEETHLTTPLFLDVLRPHVMIVTGKRGTGKCLHGDALVVLDDGRLVPIKELENDKSGVVSLDANYKMALSGKSGFYKRNVDRLLRLKLRSGREIKLTAEHPLFTVKGWKPAHELTIGSRIATPRKLDIFGDEVLPDFKVKLLAYLIAEGHVRQHGRIKLARFTNSDEKIIDEFKACVEEFDKNLAVSIYRKDTFGVIDRRRPIISERHENAKIKKRLSFGNSLISWLETIGAYGSLSKDKVIPEVVFRLDKENLKTFLNRLFSCDGSLYQRKGLYEISYSSSSEKLIRQVQHLLLRFGVVSKLRKKKIKFNGKEFRSYEILVSGGFTRIFLEEIGFYGRKEERQKGALAQQVIRNPNTNTIPKEIWDTYKPKNWAAIGRVFDYAYPKAMGESARYSPSRQKLLEISKVENNTGLRLLAKSDIFWDEIISVELLEGSFEVYDISVPEHHNFVANDIVVHNSYTMSVIVEEMIKLPDEVRGNLCSLIIDTQGIFWTMKQPSEKDVQLLNEWKMKPRGFPVEVYVPEGQAKVFANADVDFDGTFSIQPSQLSADEWLSVFDINQNEQLGILLHKVMAKFRSRANYDLDDIIAAIENEESFSSSEKLALQNRFIAAKDWGIFGAEKMPEILIGGKATVLDVSLTPQNVRALLVGLACREVFKARVSARRKEELMEMELSPAERVPMPWIFIDEAHNFLPDTGKTAATEILSTLVKEGRQPGVTLVFATQRPEKLHPDAIAQADIVIAHNLTAKADVEALKAIMQTYLLYDLGKYINELPKLKGVAIILDDNSERVYRIRVRPKQSWHAGASPVAI